MKNSLKAMMLDEKELDMVCGGVKFAYIPQRGFIKRTLMERGPNFAFILGIYYIPSPIMYEVIQAMEDEIANGNYEYEFCGKYYKTPVDDPTFDIKAKRMYMR